MKKNTVLIACSLINDRRAVTFGGVQDPIHFFHELHHSHLRERKNVLFLFLKCSTEGHVAFISNNLLAFRAEDILDEVAG